MLSFERVREVVRNGRKGTVHSAAATAERGVYASQGNEETAKFKDVFCLWAAQYIRFEESVL